MNSKPEAGASIFVLPVTAVTDNGTGPAVALVDLQGKTLLVRLGITRIIEQESLDVSLWGSTDNAEWGTKPLAAFPQKFYCGTYQIVLDLSTEPEVKYLRAQWKVNRWGRGESKPLFDFYVGVETLEGSISVQQAKAAGHASTTAG